jgi:hypothetical protein
VTITGHHASKDASYEMQHEPALVHFSSFKVSCENLGIGQVFRIALEQVAIKDGEVG